MSIVLREVTMADSDYIIGWRNDPKIMPHVMDKTKMTKETGEKFFKENVLAGKYKQFMVEKANEDYPFSYPLATIYLRNFDYTNGKAELGLIPKVDEEWNDQTKQQAIKALLKKAKEEYDLKKVYTYVIAGNDDELALMKSAGFEQEGYFKEEIGDINNREDVIRLAVVL